MDKKDLRQIIFSSAAYSLSSILGPLLILGVPAYFLDTFLGTRPIIMLVSVFIAFIMTNILLFKKVQKINHLIATKFPPKKSRNKVEGGDNIDQESKTEGQKEVPSQE
jgi:F0F1-type ATP synthase assembly protein I